MCLLLELTSLMSQTPRCATPLHWPRTVAQWDMGGEHLFGMARGGGGGGGFTLGVLVGCFGRECTHMKGKEALLCSAGHSFECPPDLLDASDMRCILETCSQTKLCDSELELIKVFYLSHSKPFVGMSATGQGREEKLLQLVLLLHQPGLAAGCDSGGVCAREHWVALWIWHPNSGYGPCYRRLHGGQPALHPCPAH